MTLFEKIKKGIDKFRVWWYNNKALWENGSAGMAELADARDLKSRVTKVTYRFETGFRHHHIAG